MHAETIKTCCGDLYASDWVRLLIGDSLHPGGLPLTERLGVLLGLDAESRVLDLAAGRGVSALYLARVFGCSVLGVDYNEENVAAAQAAAVREGMSERVRFLKGDAEQLSALPDGSFDIVICECAYCTFPNKHAAAAEIARVLRPGGRFGLSDLTRAGALPAELDGLLGWIACVADARPVASYLADLESAGLSVSRIEAHDDALTDLIDHIRGRLLAAEVVMKLQQVELPRRVDLQSAKRLMRTAAAAVKARTLGYALIVASRDSVAPRFGNATHRRRLHRAPSVSDPPR